MSMRFLSPHQRFLLLLFAAAFQAHLFPGWHLGEEFCPDLCGFSTLLSFFVLLCVLSRPLLAAENSLALSEGSDTLLHFQEDPLSPPPSPSSAGVLGCAACFLLPSFSLAQVNRHGCVCVCALLQEGEYSMEHFFFREQPQKESHACDRIVAAL